MTRDVQDFIPADILASRLVFISTGGPTVPTRALIVLLGYPLLNGYPDARVPVDSPSHVASEVQKIALFKAYLLHHLQWELENDHQFLN